ncbi:putative endonuclease [Virgibacillus natechei]|uniref:Endonuclease n=1 Tax=Virgibacillus natechei TaxID=1216297 RepID=A0ABS4IHB3_9BACI|nr:GIY-YIG nuclease family protein [Virgibacillus natechei]MBP1970338.1 putative endonuclease [Virgibacillus natechei]UZD13165.1 GIY-YIG nuclease family protein [Virgibacillus natechei]
MAEHEHTVYILKCGDNSLYTGYTNDLENRLTMHNEGKGAKYTRGRGPFQVVFVEKFSTKEEALQKEYQIKQRSRKEKFELIRDKLKEVMQFGHTEKL